jgi:hypothetical protein
MHRFFSNLLTTPRALRRAFPATALTAIEDAIRHSERRHAGEIQFAIETSIEPLAILRGVGARERAIQAFSDLQVWDTSASNGVLIYVLLSERDIEIVADRAYADYVVEDQWQGVCAAMRAAFHEGNYETGALLGIERVSALAEQCFPFDPDDVDERPNKPTVL